MPIDSMAIKKYGSGYVVISNLTGQPLIEKIFRTRRAARQAEQELGQAGTFF